MNPRQTSNFLFSSLGSVISRCYPLHKNYLLLPRQKPKNLLHETTLFDTDYVLPFTVAHGFDGGHKKKPTAADSALVKLTLHATKNAAKLKPGIYKMCACQVLQLQSVNVINANVVLLAELNTNNKISRRDRRYLRRAIRKEKIHMHNLFFDKIEVVERKTEPTDCHTIFLSLKTAYVNLKVYDILQASARN